MREIVFVMGLLSAPITAHAGCVDYTENPAPAPAFQICYKDACDVTTLDFICSNIREHRESYAIGWSMVCDVTPTDGKSVCVYFWQGRPIVPAKIDFITITDLGNQTPAR